MAAAPAAQPPRAAVRRAAAVVVAEAGSGWRPRPAQRCGRRWSCAAVLGALAAGLFAAPGRLCSVTPPTARQLQRRAAALWLSPVAAGCCAGPALGVDTNTIIEEARRKRKADAKVASVWNWESYKVPTQNYNYTKLRTYLPTVYLAKRQFQAVALQLEDPSIDKTNPITYELLREQNRLLPTKKLRKESYRTKNWLRDLKGDYDFANVQYERVKRALDEEDTQLLLLSRVEDLVDASGVRVTKRNVAAVVEAIDDLLDLLPSEEQAYAQEVADNKTIPVLKLPRVGEAFSRKNRTKTLVDQEDSSKFSDD